MNHRKPALAVPLALLALACAAHPSASEPRGRLAAEAGANRGPFELERYLNIRGNSFVGFSHDGKRVFFLSGVTGTAQLWTVPVAGGWPEQVTIFPDRVQSAAPSPAGDGVLVARDSGGNENSQLFLVSGDGASIRDLTKAPDVKHDFGGWSWDGKKIAFASNARTQKQVLAWRDAKKAGTATGDEPPTSTDVYVLEIGGAATLVYESKPGELMGAAGFSPDGTKLLLSRANGSLDNDLFVLDLATRELKHLTAHTGVASYAADWAADGKSLWTVTNVGREYPGLFRLDLASGRWDPIRTPEAEVEFASASRDGRSVAIGIAKGGGRIVEILDAASLEARELPTGPGIPGSVDFIPKTTKVGYSMNGPLDPSDVYVADFATGEKARVTTAFLAGIPRDTLVAPETARYRSFDGVEIEALLYRPPGKGPYPTIVDYHGGPEGQHRPGFAALAQYFVSRGYALFQPNVRGSLGYGRKFTHLDDVRQREASVRDGAAGVEWLKAQGIADPRRVACMGGSYGGYMVLASLTLFPDLYAAGVDIVGIANYLSFLENTSGYRRKLRESEYGVAGTEGAPGPDREFLREISPLNRVKAIKAPLLVIHGEQDPRVPVGEARQIEAALRELGRPVEAIYYPDEGHGIAKLKNRLDCYPKIVQFLDRNLAKKTVEP